MTILIYYPYNQRSVEQQSVMEMLCRKKHEVHLLTTCEEGFIHKYVRQFGVIAAASPVRLQTGIGGYFKQASYLYTYCKKNKIRIVFAHQQTTALPALLVSLFRKLQIAYFRHNSDEDYQLNATKARWLNRILNLSIKKLIAPSDKVEAHWVKNENVPIKKITRINYGYNFDQYEQPDMSESEKIRKEFSAGLLIVSIARLVAAKRHILMFEAVQLALKQGVDCKFLCIGTGPDKETLIKWIRDNKLGQNIFLMGYKSNIFDYLYAADVYLHLSSTEASNSSVKEAGIIACPCIVCAGVGDFEDYIENNKNGFLLKKDPSAMEVSELIISLSADKEYLKKTGQELKETVISRFDISKVEPHYDKLIESMN